MSFWNDGRAAMRRRLKAPAAGPAGFTLVELLIVMAIIAILATILFPVFASARDRARQAACSSNMKQIYLGYKMYAQDYDGKYALSAVMGGSSYRYVDDVYSLPTIMSGYIKSNDVWFCPSQKQSMKDAGMPGYWWVINDAQLKTPDTFENGTSATNILLWENYAYKLPSTLNVDGVNPTQWAAATEGRWCAHSGRTNFNTLSFDGHVKLMPRSTATGLCKLQAN